MSDGVPDSESGSMSRGPSDSGSEPPPQPKFARIALLLIALVLTIVLVGFYLATGGGDVADFVVSRSHHAAVSSAVASPRFSPTVPGLIQGNAPPPLSPSEAQAFQIAADKGDTYAQFRTGVIYEYGLGGILKNVPVAVRYYRMAADQGNYKAAYNLALIYEHGAENVVQDEAEAVRLFRQAAALGDPSAAFVLANILSTGNGDIPRDEAEAARPIQNRRRQRAAHGPVPSGASLFRGSRCGD